MSFLEALADKRKMYIYGIDANEGDINIDDLFGDFYPDKAHFIFELLQNAEDAEATEAIFTVTPEDCAFEHDGKRRFTEKDVRSITGIHNSTKSKSPDRIGKFGIGFKSVFVYTLTPSVYSGQFAFQILRQVVPEQLAIDPNLGDRTRFVLPFNNLKNPARVAYEEIKARLEEMAETTLLFLSGINSIRWQIDQQPTSEVLRIKHSEHHIEVQKRVGGKMTSSSHFLSFSNVVEGFGKQRVAIAFELDFLPNILTFDAKKPLDVQLVIIPANPGRVAAFFLAEKETSGLRFHIHAPFVMVPDRASIKDTPVNEPLFEQLARLAASSLHTVRDLKLLTGDFLGVLPNSRDTIPKQYQPIHNAIITEMNNEPLTPTHTKRHEPAMHLLRAKKSLKMLLSEEDLKFLVDYDEKPFKWVIGAQQKSSDVDNFLSKLAITEWDIEAFVKMLEEKASETPRVPGKDSKHANITGADFRDWLANKSEEWHQELYALLNKEFIIGAEYMQRHAIDRLKRLKIIRLSNGGYSTGSKCYFPSDGAEHDEILPRVAIGVYSSGESKVKRDAARDLLAKIGVREVGEAEQVEAILKQRYTAESLNPDINDLNRFITLVEKESVVVHVQLFADYCIFKSTGGKWVQPSQVFLDVPFWDTGLSAYYDAQGDNASRVALDPSYKDCGIPLEKIVKFAKAVRAQTQLEITEANCIGNPQWEHLRSVGGNRTNTRLDHDYTIIDIEKILKEPSLPISRLIWKTMYTLPGSPNYLKAIYQNNQSWGHYRADSQLVHHLKNAAWVPQRGGRFVRPSKAASELLPEGFPFDAGQAWIKAVHFGEEVMPMTEKPKEKEAAAIGLGFPDQKSLKDAQWFAGLPEEERQQFRDKHQSWHEPGREPTERRSERVGELAGEATERLTDQRTMSVSVGIDKVKKEAEPYLLQQYTNDDGQMFCQVCKKPMPFKLADGNYYFEKVEFLPELKRLHYQNYLALCPNHAAMFQYANGSSDKLKDMFIEIGSKELEVVLAQKNTTIYFTKTHIADLKAVIKADQRENEQDVQS